MAELERLGYIMQPHTSSGRVPTDKGYRFYVNNLSEKNSSIEERRGEKALSTASQSAGEPERVIRTPLIRS